MLRTRRSRSIRSRVDAPALSLWCSVASAYYQMHSRVRSRSEGARSRSEVRFRGVEFRSTSELRGNGSSYSGSHG